MTTPKKRIFGMPEDFVRRRAGRSLFDNHHELHAERLKSWQANHALERIVSAQEAELKKAQKYVKTKQKEKKLQFMKDPVYSKIAMRLKRFETIKSPNREQKHEMERMSMILGDFRLGRINEDLYKLFAEQFAVTLPKYNKNGHEIPAKQIP